MQPGKGTHIAFIQPVFGSKEEEGTMVLSTHRRRCFTGNGKFCTRRSKCSMCHSTSGYGARLARSFASRVERRQHDAQQIIHEGTQNVERKAHTNVIIRIQEKKCLTFSSQSWIRFKNQQEGPIRAEERSPHSCTVAEKRFGHGRTQLLPEAAKHCSGSNERFV